MPALPGEVAFLVRHGVPPGTLREAVRISRGCGVSADEALIREGLLDERTFYRALADEAGLPFRDELDVHPMARFPAAALAGVVPLVGFDPLHLHLGCAPRGPQVVQVISLGRLLGPGFVVTTPTAIRDHLLVARAGPIAAEAADGLARLSPAESYRGGASVRQVAAGAAFGSAATALGFEGTAEMWLVVSLVAALVFLGTTALRLAAVLERVPIAPPRLLPRIPDHALPVYTVLVALHREGRVVEKLVRALSALDYPAAKLDVKLVIETGDRDTSDALAALRLPGFVEVIVAPPGEPRTKPRALNVALPLARGAFLAIYDAEDVPDPGQLRLAVCTFRRSEPDVACLQARLAIDNAADGLLTRLFAIEYAALFDVINPALSRFDMPVPLGGTSNHFRTEVLAALGGWDAWNVTEDADLGIRLAAAGYRVGDLPSTTLEEAPRKFRPWLRQRTRWMKGFLQVSITHSRRPVLTWRRFGTARLLGAAAVSAGTVVSAFSFPMLATIGVAEIVRGRFLEADSPLEVAVAASGLTLLAAGYLAMVLPPLAALRRRGWTRLLPLVPLMPLYYGLVSLAAWRGLFELLLHPARWNKTEHGLARTSWSGLTAAGPSPSPRPPATGRD